MSKTKKVSVATGNRRLLKLADLLEADAKNKRGVKFDYSSWGYMENPQRPMSCGTSACAMGLAALSGEFKRAGLGYKFRFLGSRSIEVTFKGKGWGISSASKLFGITESEAKHLFIEADIGWQMEGARAERAVAKHIRKFVAARA